MFSRREVIYFVGLVALVLYTFAPVWIYNARGVLPQFLLTEDGLYETLASLCVLTGSVLLFRHFKKASFVEKGLFVLKGRNYAFLFFAIGMMFLFLEEISWGQRILGIDTPEYFERINYQGDLNLHNLSTIQERNNSLSGSLFKWLRSFLKYVPIIVFIFPAMRALMNRLNLPVPSLYVAFLVMLAERFSTLCYSGIYGSGYKLDPHFSDALHVGEIFEGNLEILLLVFVIEIVSNKRN